LYCHYCSVMHVTVMPVSAYMALAFVFGFIPNKLMMMTNVNKRGYAYPQWIPVRLQVASVHHEYGRQTLATAGLLYCNGSLWLIWP